MDEILEPSYNFYCAGIDRLVPLMTKIDTKANSSLYHSAILKLKCNMVMYYLLQFCGLRVDRAASALQISNMQLKDAVYQVKCI